VLSNFQPAPWQQAMRKCKTHTCVAEPTRCGAAAGRMPKSGSSSAPVLLSTVAIVRFLRAAGGSALVASSRNDGAKQLAGVKTPSDLCGEVAAASGLVQSSAEQSFRSLRSKLRNEPWRITSMS